MGESTKGFLEQRILKLKLPGAGFLFAYKKNIEWNVYVYACIVIYKLLNA